MDLPLLTEDDIENITYGIEHNADLIFASFVNDPDDIKCFRSLLGITLICFYFILFNFFMFVVYEFLPTKPFLTVKN